MYKKHSSCDSPSNESIIWRYMDFAKLLYILEYRTLHFTRSDNFDDIFEGSTTNKNIELWKNSLLERIPENVVDALIEDLRRTRNPLCKFIAISCWYLSEFESAAMWKLYSQSYYGVAVQSTYARLCDSFNNTSENIYIGKVKYIDYEKQHIPVNSPFCPFFYKRLSFEHEHELRAIVFKLPEISPADWTQEPMETGLSIAIDIDTLIEKIYVSPSAPNWFYDLVKLTVSRYNTGKEVIRSNLLKSPVFF